MAQLPHIHGTADDNAINGLIDECNRQNNLGFSAHAAAAIIRYLLENHEVEAGTKWTAEVSPIVMHVHINEEFVNKVYQRLSEYSELKRIGCPIIPILIILIALAAGLAWWYFS